MHRLSHWSGQQQHLLQRLQALGAQEMQWAQALDKGPWLQMYMVPGNCRPLGRQTTEGSPGRTWQAGGGSFLLVPRRHALSSRWLKLPTTTRVKTAWKKHWVHKKCSGLKHLKKDPDYRCTRCQGTARPLDGRPQKEVQVGPDKLEVVASFCYLGDMLSAAGGCELSTTTCVKTAWKKFKDLLPVLSSRHLSFKTRGHVYSSCVRSAMLHASETWPLTKLNLQRLQQNDRAMIRQICNVRPQDIVTTRSNELLVRLGIEDLDLILKERRLRWYGHVERSSGTIKTAFDIQVDGKRGPGRPKMTWKQLTERDCREWKLSAINPHDRRTWRSGVRSAMHAASQLSGRGPTDVDVAPVPAR